MPTGSTVKLSRRWGSRIVGSGSLLGEGVRFGVFAREGAGGALVEAADLAGGELVKEKLAGLVEGLGSDHLAAEVAEVGQPIAGVERELGVDLFAQALGERRAGSSGGDGNLQITATDNGREVEVAVRWVVDGVADDVG